METYKKKIIITLLAASFLLMAGCGSKQRPALSDSQNPIEIALSLNNELAELPPSKEAISNRFYEPATERTTVDSVIQLSEKLAQLSEKLSQEKQRNTALLSLNKELKQKILATEPDLVQAKKELKDANNLLIEMRLELNNWKVDIIGFRNEMRLADTEQLHALLKILKVLGGEVNNEFEEPGNNNATSSTSQRTDESEINES